MLVRKIFKIVRRKLTQEKYKKISANEHNSLENVDNLNKDKEYWVNVRLSDKKFIENIFDFITHSAQIKDGDSIGDVGCGTGVLVSKFKDAFPNSTIKGYDFSGNKIQQCNKYYNIGENVFYIHNIYSELPQRFDILVATEVLEHLEYPEVALDNLLSGLNYKGRLFITVPNGREDTFSGHIHFWSPESWRLFIKKNIKNPFDVEVGNVFNNNYALITRVDVE